MATEWGDITGHIEDQADLQAALATKFVLPALTAGSVLFSDGSTIAQRNANFFWDNTNKRLGIGTSAPGSELHVAGAITIPATTSSTTGVIYKGSTSFAHNFAHSGTSGNNTFLGLGAGNFSLTGSSGTDGSFNTAIGQQSMSALTTGKINTAVGALALSNATSAVANTAIGYATMISITSGHNNTAVGNQSLYYTTVGDSLTAIGNSALQDNTTGNDSTAVGALALFSNTTANYNVGVGYGSLYTNNGHNNVSIGWRSSYFHATGDSNTVVGTTALEKHTGGARNSAFGANALNGNLTGSGNVALGYGAGNYETGSDKLFIDNATRENEADGRVRALIYGVFDVEVVNQFLTVNAQLQVTGTGDSYVLGNVGIGTDSPTTRLTIQNATDGTTNPFLILNSSGNMVCEANVNSSGQGLLGIGDDGARLIQFSAAGSSFIDAGDFGIGTTTPAHKLQVAQDLVRGSDGDVSQIAASGATDANKRLTLGYDTTSNYGYIDAVIVGSSWSDLALQASGGNVGIGTKAPNKVLEINSASGDNLRLTYDDPNGSATTYMDTGVSSSGVATWTVAGSAPGFAFAGGRVAPPAATASYASLNLPVGTAPTSPEDGDIWREDNTDTGLKIRIDGVTKTIMVT